MVNMDFDEGDFGDLEDDLPKWGNALISNIDAGMIALAEAMRQRLYDITKKKTGETASAWTVLPGAPGEFMITNSNSPIIDYLTLGTAAHFVAPVTAKALHWVDDSGQDRFSKGHWVSGIVGEDYEAEVLAEFDPIIETLIDASLDAADRTVGFT